MSDKVATTSAVKHIKFQYIDTKSKAIAMLQFLSNEILRHQKDIENAEKDIEILCKKWELKKPKNKEIVWYETNPK